jgi:hypothetical protein
MRWVRIVPAALDREPEEGVLVDGRVRSDV